MFNLGDRVRRAGKGASTDREIPEGTLGTVIAEASANPFGWIRVEWDGVPPSLLAQSLGETGFLMAEDEMEPA